VKCCAEKWAVKLKKTALSGLDNRKKEYCDATTDTRYFIVVYGVQFCIADAMAIAFYQRPCLDVSTASALVSFIAADIRRDSLRRNGNL
jgi:hypothetical protein